MTIQPLSNRLEISVTGPFEPAYERVKQMLFRPFDFTKWILVGFCAWLARLGEAGGSGFNTFYYNPGNGAGSHQQVEQLQQAWHQAADYVVVNLVWILPLVSTLLVLGIAFLLLMLWLNSHGKFMFLDCVAFDRAEIESSWRKSSAEANSLFWFRLGFSVAATVCALMPLAPMAICIATMVRNGKADLAGILLAAALGLALFLMGVAFAIARKFTFDFVAPIMVLRTIPCLSAWRDFWGLLCANPEPFALYILVQIALEIAIQALVVAVILLTCCIAGCLMALPFIGAVILLPILVFKRAYSLYFLAQFGPQYDFFPPAPLPPAGPLPQSPLAPVA